MILVDSNILMYAGGKDHAYRDRCVGFLAKVLRGSISATIDAETLQEILHRYRMTNRMAEGWIIFDGARVFFPAVLPVTAEVMDGARVLMDRYPQLVARDAVHAAVVQTNSLSSICSFDRDFDRIAGLKRIEP